MVDRFPELPSAIDLDMNLVIDSRKISLCFSVLHATSKYRDISQSIVQSALIN